MQVYHEKETMSEDEDPKENRATEKELISQAMVRQREGGGASVTW